MLKCDICLSEDHYKLRCESGIWACGNCLSKRYDEPMTSPGIIETENVGSLPNIWKSRLKELHRRVILPYEVPGHDYVIGRRNDDGSISDKPCDIRP